MRVCFAPLLLLVACTGKGNDTAEMSAGPWPQTPWPEWAWEPWVWEDESTQESALALVEGYLDHDIPTGAIIIDSPWETGYDTFEFDSALFPDPQAMIDEFHARDVRVMLWAVPVINVEVKDLYEHAASRGWFMQTNATSGPAVIDWWKGEGSLIDFFNPDAVEWWHSLLDKALALDIDGWKCDGADFSAIFTPWSPGLGADVERIEYSHAYYQDFFEYTRQELGPDRVITARPVDNYGLGLGGELVSFAPRYLNFAGWVGDQDPDFAGLEAALNNMYFSAEQGYLAFGSDIGGYREDGDLEGGRDKETFLRWAQLGAFCPVMENGGGGEHRPWAFDTETSSIYRDFATLHVKLLPYLRRHAAERWYTGASLFTFLDSERYRYLLGPDLFVQPILQEGSSFEIELPEGDWVWIFDPSLVFEGSTLVTLDVPLTAFPAFVRQGSTLASELLP